MQELIREQSKVIPNTPPAIFYQIAYRIYKRDGVKWNDAMKAASISEEFRKWKNSDESKEYRKKTSVEKRIAIKEAINIEKKKAKEKKKEPNESGKGVKAKNEILKQIDVDIVRDKNGYKKKHGK